MKIYTRWDDVPSRFIGAVKIGKNELGGLYVMIAAGETMADAKKTSWDAFGHLDKEVMVRSLSEDGRYTGPSRYEGEPWSDER